MPFDFIGGFCCDICMVTNILFRFVLMGFCLSSVSCVLGHREVALSIPAGTHAAAKGKVSFALVSDSRAFQNKPDEPSTPSVDGDVNSLSAAQRDTYIGRQRNGYGKAMGDVVLPAGGTVTAKARELVTEALARRGYQVGAGGTTVKVNVQRFWGWSNPGMWSISIKAHVDCDVTVGGRSFHAEGVAQNNCHAATTRNWEQAYGEAFEAFLQNLDGKLAAAGL